MKKRLKSISAVIFVSLIFVTLGLGGEAASKEIKLELYGHKLGSSGYVGTFALSEFINKSSKRLKAVAIETTLGGTENALSVVRNPGKRDRMVIFFNNWSWWQITNGLRPYKAPFKDIKFIGRYGLPMLFFVTKNPNIKSIEDMKGKRVGLPRIGAPSEAGMKMLLEHGHGLTYNDLKMSHGGFSQLADALIDGRLDVIFGAALVAGSEPYDLNPTPALEKLFMSKECFLVPETKDAINKTRKITGAPLYAFSSKPIKIGKTSLPAITAWGLTLGWAAPKQMPDDVVTEIVSVLYENADKFGSYHAALRGLIRENLGAHAVPKEAYHPAAIKFYESKGIKVGME